MKNKNITMVTVPSAFITKSKQRTKQYNDTVYLKNGDEFEIELFNPTQNKILAKVKIDGKGIGGSGIVLRPGERVHLERYIDVAKKFLFETYKVNGNNSDVQKAIENNGNVEIEFYDEYVAPIFHNRNLTINYPWNNPWGGGVYYYTDPNVHRFTTTRTAFTSNNNCANFTSQPSITTSSVSMGSLSDCCTYTSNAQTIPISSKGTLRSLSHKPIVEKTKEIETGRVEKGSTSAQVFTYDHTTFNTYYSWRTTWKIVPVSQKQIVKEDLVICCGECGTKRKKDSHKYCPLCGEKY